VRADRGKLILSAMAAAPKTRRTSLRNSSDGSRRPRADAALSLSDNVAAVTAIGNDCSYGLTFAPQVKFPGRRRARALDERFIVERALRMHSAP
jgi:hypothetical protein